MCLHGARVGLNDGVSPCAVGAASVEACLYSAYPYTDETRSTNTDLPIIDGFSVGPSRRLLSNVRSWPCLPKSSKSH